MHFSLREKEIVNCVASGEIHDLSSYLAAMVPLKEETNEWANISGTGVNIPMGTVVKMVDDEEALAKELHFFIALCYKLQSFQLLQIVENRGFKDFPPILMRQPGGGVNLPPKIRNLFANNMFFEIVSFDELNRFIEDGFLTVEEKNLQDERNARETAQKTTVLVAIVSLLISTATLVGVTYFNYKTYSTERKVSISNLDAIQYPIPVSIIECPNQSEVNAKPLTPFSSRTAQKRATP